LHFSGKFKNQPPLYNNEPSNREIPYDYRKTPDDVKKITEGVEPGEIEKVRIQSCRTFRKVSSRDFINGRI